jgi:hypothetical protein
MEKDSFMFEAIEEVSWIEREKYGCLGKYIVNKDIYQELPESWNQKPELVTAKGTIINVVEYKDKHVWEEQFCTLGRWFKRKDIIPIKEHTVTVIKGK